MGLILSLVFNVFFLHDLKTALATLFKDKSCYIPVGELFQQLGPANRDEHS